MALVISDNNRDKIPDDVSVFYFFDNPLKPYLQTFDSNLDRILETIIKYKNGLEVSTFTRNNQGEIIEIK